MGKKLWSSEGRRFQLILRMVDAVLPDHPRRRMVALQVPDKDDGG